MRLIRTTPAPIWIISILFLILPILSYIATADSYRLSLWEAHKVFLSMQPFQILIVIASLFVAFGILSRKLIGYYAFLLFSGILILYNLWLIILFYWGTKIEVAGLLVTSTDILGNVFLSTFLLIGIFYFLNREVQAPYFSDNARGWRRDSRETIPLSYSLEWNSESIPGTTINISQSGALLAWDNENCPEEGSLIPVMIEYENMEGESTRFRFESVVMRSSKNPNLPGTMQVGVRFLRNRSNEEGVLGIEYFLKERYAPRYSIFQEIRFGKESFEDNKAIISDVSVDGLFVESSVVMKTGDEIYIKIPTVPSIRLEGRVTWCNDSAKFGKNRGFGVHIVFNRNPLRFRIWLLKIQIRSLKSR